jgi:putative SOS response-associated peptidase YedK
MCLYTQQNATKKNVKERFNAEIEDEDSYLEADLVKGFSYPNLPIILDTMPEIITTSFRWGLIPQWANNLDIRNYMLNAHIKTIEEKPSFRYITQNRCLIIATAYYGWRWNNDKKKTKEKYQINSQDDEIFTFAGLYNEGINPKTGEVLNTYTILTTEANALMKFVDKNKETMPVILKKNDESAWLDSSNKIADFAFPYQAARNIMILENAQKEFGKQYNFELQ